MAWEQQPDADIDIASRKGLEWPWFSFLLAAAICQWWLSMGPPGKGKGKRDSDCPFFVLLSSGHRSSSQKWFFFKLSFPSPTVTSLKHTTVSSKSMPHVDPPEAKNTFEPDTGRMSAETCRDQNRVLLQEDITKIGITNSIYNRHAAQTSLFLVFLTRNLLFFSRL